MPAGNVYRIKVFRHLREHCRLQAAVRVASVAILNIIPVSQTILGEMIKTYLEPAFKDIPQFLTHSIAWVLNLEVPSFGNNLLGRERPLGVPPSRVRPPFLHGVDVRLV